MNREQQLLLWADELRALCNNGLLFVKSSYDQENYERIRQIAAEMIAASSDLTVHESQEQLTSLFGHYTPLVMGDAHVINEQGEMLLMQRSDSGLWATPGGAFNVGETPTEGVTRECLEETGWLIKPTQLIGIYDSRLVETRTGNHVYHLSFLCEPIEQVTKNASHAAETLNTGWFTQDNLPPLHVGHRIWVPHGFRMWSDKAVAAVIYSE